MVYDNKGFTNWKDGAAKILQHEQSEHHREAYKELYILPHRVRDVGEMIDPGHARDKAENRKMSLTIIVFLARQGLPLRADGDEQDSRFYFFNLTDLVNG